MPYNPSTGVYSLPAIYLAVPGTVIIAAQHNDPLVDLQTANNYPRPVIAGGTGSSTTAGAASSLKVVSYEAQSLSDAERGIARTNIAAIGYDSQTLTAAQQAVARTNISAPLSGYLFGLTLSNNVGDPVNDIDIAVGQASSTETQPVLMTLASTLTKRLDAAWAVGSGNGGLDTGSIANTTYHVWLIQRSDTGVVDALFSTSATSPTMPTNYDRKRRIGSIIRESAAIVGFSQNGDVFLRTTPVNDLANVVLSTTATLAALSVPSGIVVDALIRGSINNGATVLSSIVLITSPSETDRPPGVILGDYDLQQQVVNVPVGYTEAVRTNTSRQIRFRSGNATTSTATTTYGWIDTRGRT